MPFMAVWMKKEKIGSDYVVNLMVDTDLNRSSKTDRLGRYCGLCSAERHCKREMANTSKLLEQVAKRIIIRILRESPAVTLQKLGKSGKEKPSNWWKCGRSCR